MTNEKEKDKLMRSVAQDFIDQGKREGLQEGRVEERFQVAKSMLKEGAAIPFIQKVTGLSQIELSKI